MTVSKLFKGIEILRTKLNICVKQGRKRPILYSMLDQVTIGLKTFLKTPQTVFSCVIMTAL